MRWGCGVIPHGGDWVAAARGGVRGAAKHVAPPLCNRRPLGRCAQVSGRDEASAADAAGAGRRLGGRRGEEGGRGHGGGHRPGHHLLLVRGDGHGGQAGLAGSAQALLGRQGPREPREAPAGPGGRGEEQKGGGGWMCAGRGPA